MLHRIKLKWYFSKLRFFILNSTWNYKFWLNCKKEYKIIEYYTFPSQRSEPIKMTKKRFIGYNYKGVIYLDNPGLPIKDRNLWLHWKKNGLIK